MKRFHCMIVGVSAVCMASGVAAQSLLLGPKGRFSTGFIGESLEYDPSRGCYKPSRPYSDDRESWTIYRSSAERYLDCMKRAADSDMEYVQEVVQKGYDDAVSEFLREVGRGY